MCVCVTLYYILTCNVYVWFLRGGVVNVELVDRGQTPEILEFSVELFIRNLHVLYLYMYWGMLM